ncbi:MAG TPA: hypothetical protein PLU00_00095 [Candidatus Pacearchaeota archaeon]|nr:hypothetical protein [Candidatus Pacearchaeota archaeon]HOL90190.1 hypothetical protein [Candidatus Pacearchaeota archaeon]
MRKKGQYQIVFYSISLNDHKVPLGISKGTPSEAIEKMKKRMKFYSHVGFGRIGVFSTVFGGTDYKKARKLFLKFKKQKP